MLWALRRGGIASLFVLNAGYEFEGRRPAGTNKGSGVFEDSARCCEWDSPGGGTVSGNHLGSRLSDAVRSWHREPVSRHWPTRACHMAAAIFARRSGSVFFRWPFRLAFSAQRWHCSPTLAGV